MNSRFLSILLAGAALLCSGQFLAKAQQRNIFGTVADNSDSSPMAGVAVVVEGSANRVTITDLDGKYSISASKGETLVFSFLGMVDEKRVIGDGDRIDVALRPDRTVLDDVIVVAYGTTKKESFTGSADVVTSEKFKDRPVTDVTKILDGAVAGVMTTSGSGQPGSGASLRVRGFGSINASSAPLIVVDGVPFEGDLNSINSNDIESMSVLKDASAGALYGARGANGVVLVTTKQRPAGAETMSVQLSAKVGINDRAIPFYNTLSASEYMEHMYSACYNDLVSVEGYLPKTAKDMTPSRLSKMILGTDEIYNIYDKPSSELFDPQGHIVKGAKLKYDTDWMKEARARCPIRQEYQVSLNGSGKNSRYLASLSYLNEKGTLKTTGFKRYTARVGADFSPRKWLDFGANINYAHTNSQFLGAEGTQSTNVWYSAMMMAPIYPIYEVNQDGSYILENGKRVFDYGSSRPAGAQNNRNSVATLFDDDYYTLTDNLSARAYAALNWRDFKLSTNIGLDNVNSYQTTKFNRYSGNAAGTGRLSKQTSRLMSYTWNQLLTYKARFGSHNIDAMAGHEFYNYNMRYVIAERTGFPFAEYDDLGMGSTLSDANSESDNYSIDSWLCRVNYDYYNRYYLSASFRMDASSRFKREHRWGAFWSVGASWRISQEKWLSNVSWIDNITLKASYGVQGNDDLGSFYAWQSLYDMNYPNANNSGAIIESIENEDVTWEKNGNLNIGLEFKLFGRLSGTIEWYNRETTDLLLERPMAISLGFPGYYANVGSLRNRGFDITIGGDVISTKDWLWNITLIGSSLSNKVLKLSDNGEDIVNGVYIIREGEEINTFYMAKSAGVDPATGDQLYLAYQKNPDGTRIKGSEYVTNDATVAASCKWLQGSRIPDLYGSISSSLKFRDFDLGLLFTYSIGGKVYDSVYNSLMEPSFVGQTYHRNALRSWSSPGEKTDVPRVTTSTVSQITDLFLIDASYFAIKNISLGYSLPSKLLHKAKIDAVRFYLSADSPWIFTHLKGMNPQTSFTGSTSYSYTPNRTFSLGVDLKF